MRTIVFAFVLMAATAAEDQSELEMCLSFAKKFFSNRICKQQELAAYCMRLDAPTRITRSLDKCYKDLQLDPIDTRNTVTQLCLSEELQEKASDCVCQCLVKLMYEDYSYEEETGSLSNEYDPSKNENIEPEPFNTTIMHCFSYMEEIQAKKD
ncbi:hypothetical protein X975_22382, partial [Stegodyphus mimosarum]